MGCADSPSKRVGAPISVLELTKNEVDESSMSHRAVHRGRAAHKD